MKTHDGRDAATEDKHAAMRDLVMTWDEISDELIWGNFSHDDPDDKPINAERLELFCKRFPHFADQLRDYVKHWNARPIISDEMLAAVEVSEEKLNRTWRHTKQILDFYLKLRGVEHERDALKSDCMTLVLRLLDEPDNTFAPETHKVMSKWRPLAEALLKE